MTIRTPAQLKARFQSDDSQDSWNDMVDSVGGGASAFKAAVTFASATQTLGTVPANSTIDSVKVIRTTAWDAITTFQVGKTGTADWLVSTVQASVDTAIDSGEAGNVEIIEPAKVVTTATDIILTLNQGGAAAGAGYVVVEYSTLA